MVWGLILLTIPNKFSLQELLMIGVESKLIFWQCDIVYPIFTKGIFKDHLIEWINKYLIMTHGKTASEAIIDDIDWW